KEIKPFSSWGLMKEKVHTLFQVASIVEELTPLEESSIPKRSIMNALKNFYIAYAEMEAMKGQGNVEELVGKEVKHLRTALRHLVDLYPIWKRLIAFYLKLFLTQKNFLDPSIDLEKAKRILSNFRKYIPFAPLQDCDPFYAIHFNYLKKSKFKEFFQLMKENVLEKMIENSELSLDELFSVQRGFYDLIENEQFLNLEDYRDKVYSGIKNEELKSWLQEWEKNRVKQEILDSLRI